MQYARQNNSRGFIGVLFLSVFCAVSSYALTPEENQSSITPFNPFGLPSSRSTSPVFNRFAGLPPLTARIPDKGEWCLIPSIEISQLFTDGYYNLVDGTNKEIRYLDYEAYAFEVPASIGLGKGLALGIDIQFQYITGGFLDSTIEGFHSLFGFPSNNRESFPKNDLIVNIPTNNGFSLQADHPELLVSDPQIFLQAGLFKQGTVTLSALLIGSFPIYLSDGLAGTTLPQLGTGAYLDWNPLPWLLLRANSGVVVPFDVFVPVNGQTPHPYGMARLSGLFNLGSSIFLFLDFNLRGSAITTNIKTGNSDFFAIPNADMLVGFIFSGNNTKGTFGSFTVQEDPFSNNASDITFIWSGGFSGR